MESIMPSLTLFPKSTALVLIDLQKGITSFRVEPHPTQHDFATQNIFPRLGRVRTAVEIARALRESD
jgi:nicotinamidase-related amidase